MKTMTALVACLALVSAGSIAAEPAQRPVSLYQMQEQLRSQDGAAIGLDVYRGQRVLVTMFYGSCPASCPLIIDTLRALERAAGAGVQRELRVLLISFDPVRDTPQALRQLADARRIDTRRWTLAQADAAAARRIAAALGVQYRQLPSGEFSHANVISVLSAQGEILAQSTELGSQDPVILAALAR
jgi:protein SCO1/2